MADRHSDPDHHPALSVQRDLALRLSGRLPGPRQPPHAFHLITHLLDTSPGGGERLDLDRHVEGIGVQEVLGAYHDADMALPEHKIAAAELNARPPIDVAAELFGLRGFISISAGMDEDALRQGLKNVGKGIDQLKAKRG